MSTQQWVDQRRDSSSAGRADRAGAATFCPPCTDRASTWESVLCGTRARLHSDDPSAQFLRFVLVGVVTTLLYFGTFLALRGVDAQMANLVGAVLSSALANELHRRQTFRAEGRVSWAKAQWEGGALAAAGLVATTAALAALDGLLGTAWWAQLIVIAGVTGAVGLLRFVALRLWVFSVRVHGPVATLA